MLKKIKNLFLWKTYGVLANFALTFAGGSVQRFCSYIFHQSKMSKKLLRQVKNNYGKVSYFLSDYLAQKEKIAIESCIYQYESQIDLEISFNTLMSILIAVFSIWNGNLNFLYCICNVVSLCWRSVSGTYWSCMTCSCMSLAGLLPVSNVDSPGSW